MDTPSLREVEDALDAYPPETAVLVTDAEGTLLAAREVSEANGAVLVVLGVDPDQITWRPE
jgi:ABC-type sugar transport system substrate-binding protein